MTDCLHEVSFLCFFPGMGRSGQLLVLELHESRSIRAPRYLTLGKVSPENHVPAYLKPDPRFSWRRRMGYLVCQSEIPDRLAFMQSPRYLAFTPTLNAVPTKPYSLLGSSALIASLMARQQRSSHRR